MPYTAATSNGSLRASSWPLSTDVAQAHLPYRPMKAFPTWADQRLTAGNALALDTRRFDQVSHARAMASAVILAATSRLPGTQ